MQQLVEPKEITRLRPYEMIARIGTEIVRVKTLPPPPRAAGGNAQRLIALSRQKYCKPVAEIDREIRRRSERWCQPFTPLTGDIQEWPCTEEDLKYEEF